MGDSFTAELTDVRLVGPLLGPPPLLLHEATVATMTVPEEAASSDVSCCLFVDINMSLGRMSPQGCSHIVSVLEETSSMSI